MDERGVITEVVSGTIEEISFPTLRFGEVKVAASRVIEFPRGLVGMPSARRFVFLHQEEAEGPFFWLQSVDDPALAFVVCEPQHFFPDYSVPLSSEDQRLLHLETEEDGVVCVILVVPEDPRKITANLRGPLVVNTNERVGTQVVLSDEDFPTQAPLFENPTTGGAACSS